jgi:hypothetical protein
LYFWKIFNGDSEMKNKNNIDYEVIKQNKTDEATNLFLKLGITYNDEYDINQMKMFYKKNKTISNDSKLYWTRLSINSHNGFIVE